MSYQLNFSAVHDNRPVERPTHNNRSGPAGMHAKNQAPQPARNSPVAILIQKIRLEKELWKAKDSCEVAFIRYDAVAMATMDWEKRAQATGGVVRARWKIASYGKLRLDRNR